MRCRRAGWSRAALLLALLLAPGGLAAQEDDEALRVGAAVGYSTHFERPFLAVDLLVPIQGPFLLVPHASYTDADVRRLVLGLEFHWTPPAHRLHRRLLGWVGAGLGVVSDDPRGPVGSTTRDLQATVTAGVGYDAPATPFLQVRTGLNGRTDVGLSVGVRF